METRPKLIPIGLPPPVISKTEYTPPDLYLSLPETTPESDKPAEPPAAINTGFDQMYSELFRSFKEDIILKPDVQEKPERRARRHTDEKIKTIASLKEFSEKMNTVKKAPVSGSGATCEVPKQRALGFEERKRKPLSPRKPSKDLSLDIDQKSNDDKGLAESKPATSTTTRRPARELFPPIELKFRPSRKTGPTNCNKSTNDAIVQFEQLSITDDGKEKEPTTPSTTSTLESGALNSAGLRLEKRSYDDSELEEVLEIPSSSISPLSLMTELCTGNAVYDRALNCIVTVEEPKMPGENHTRYLDMYSRDGRNGCLLMAVLSLLVLAMMEIVGAGGRRSRS